MLRSLNIPGNPWTFLHFQYSNGMSETFAWRFIAAPILHNEPHNRLSVVRGTGGAEKRWIFYLRLNQIVTCSQYTCNHQKQGTWLSARFWNWEKKCVSVFNCLHWHPKALFWFLLSLLISTFGCNYKYCHKTHPSVTCPSKPLLLVCLLNDDHYIFPPFQSHCTWK